MEDPISVVAASVDITLWVPRGAAGDLTAGAMAVLVDATPIASVDGIDVVGCRPTATDIRVDLTAELGVYTPEPAALEAVLCDCFGIITAEVRTVRA